MSCVAAMVWTADHDSRHAKLAGADSQLSADACAERGRQARVGPNFAAAGIAGGWSWRAERFVRQHHLATQGIRG
jgi:hypothetical protein